MHTAAEPSGLRFEYRPVAIAVASALLLSAGLSAQAQSFTQSGANSTTGNPSGLPFVGNPVSLNFGTDTIYIANGAAGSFAALAGAVLQAGALSVANGATGVGTFTATGINPGTGLATKVLLGGSNVNRLEVGNWGNGTMTVSGGALVDATVNPLACGTGCYSFIGNAAGSTATLDITGAGSELRTMRTFVVGQTSVFTNPPNNFQFGTPGGTTNAFVNVLNGGTLRTEVAQIASNTTTPNGNGAEKVNATVVVSGAGSQWFVSRNSVDNQVASLTVGTNANGSGSLTVSNGGKVRVDGTGGPAGQDDFISLGINNGTGTLSVTGAGSSLVMAGYGGAIQAGRSGAAATGSFSVLAGASASAVFLNVGRDGATGSVLLNGPGTQLRLSGQGAYSSGGVGSAGGTIGWGGSGQVTVSNGALWHISDGGTDSSATNRGPGITLGFASGVGAGNGGLAITGANSRVEIVSSSLAPVGGAADNGNPFVHVGRDSGSTGSVTIGAGGKLLLTGNALSTPAFERTTYLGIGGTSDNAAGGTGSLSITGAGSEARLTGTDAFVSVGRNGTGTLNLSNGALLAATSINVGRGATATSVGNGTMTMNAAKVELNGFFTNSVGSGASLSVGNRGGTGSLSMSNASTVTVTNLSPAGASFNLGGTTPNPLGTGTLNMSGGSSITVTAGAGLASASIGRDGTGVATLQGNSFIDIGDGTAHLGRLATGNATLSLQSGSKLLTGITHIGGSSDVDAGGTANVLVSGAGSELRASGPTAFIGVGRGGTGTLTLNGGGTATATAMSIGRNGGLGTLTVNSSTLNLGGQQTGGNQVGANLAIGLGGAAGGLGGGTGIANIVNGSTVNITNYTAVGNAGANLVLGGSSLYRQGNGTLNLAGGSRINVLAAAGVGGATTLGAVTIGNNGSGTAVLNGASAIDVGAGNVYVARQPGSSGTLVLNANSVVNAGFVGVGVSAPGVGNAPGALGGTGTLVLNNSTINTSRFELGANSLLTGNNGVINVADTVNPVTGLPVKGPVVIAGTVSPGNSPGRIRINCDLTMLAGSKLILEIDDNGASFDVDQLIIGNESNFDLNSLQIIFSFIGDTNPNAFAASPGGFNLDRFLKAGNGADERAGLSSLFAQGTNWNNHVSSDLFTFESSAYDVTKMSFDADTARSRSRRQRSSRSRPAWHWCCWPSPAMGVAGRRRAAAARRA